MDGSSTPAEDEVGARLNPGTRLGKYEIVRLLGAGGMGAVYEAAHTEIGKRVAVKVLSPAIAAIPGTRGRFLREAQLTSRVRHPNIVDVTDMGSEGGETFLVMELLRGEDLARRLGREGHLSPQSVADIMLPVCSAVAAAHEAAVTHRDLKPSNIFLSETQHAVEPKILDFGISKGMDSSVGPEALTGTGAMVGTPFYLAPEQIVDNRSAGPASDQYALGVILYECLTGVRPFQNDSLYAVFRDIVEGAARPPRAHRPEISPALEQIVLRAMHVDPKARFESAKALGRALLPFASSRARSIWQDAFESGGPSPDGVGVGGDPASGVRTGRAVTATRVLTPSADSGSAGPVGLAGGTQIAAAIGPARPRMGRQRLPADDDTPEPIALVRPSRPLLRLVIAGGILLGGIGAWFVLIDQPQSASLSESGKKRKRTPGRSDAPAHQAPRPGESGASREPNKPGSPTLTNPEPLESFELSVSVDPDTALIELDGRPVGRGRLQRSLPLDHQPHRLQLVADGYNSELVEFTDVPPPKHITLTRAVVHAPVAEPRSRSQRPRHRSTVSRKPAAAKQASPPQQLNANGAPIVE